MNNLILQAVLDNSLKKNHLKDDVFLPSSADPRLNMIIISREFDSLAVVLVLARSQLRSPVWRIGLSPGWLAL